MPTCSQPKCPIATTGVCLEGHKQGCPHLLSDVDAPAEVPGESISTSSPHPPTPDPYRFYSGEKLTASEASRIMSAKPVKMILCAGAPSAGKTTFLARIGEMFRNGTFRDYRFAGSKTLCAFERISWLATIPSGVARPKTLRTHRSEQDTFFHIRVQPTGSPSNRFEILVSDLPGENFPTALASREFCAEQRALARADHLVLLLDCESLVDNRRRGAEWDNASLFLSQVKKCRHEPNELQVHVVFSRWDYVSRSGERHKHEEFCKTVEGDLGERFKDSFAGGLRFARIAARPDGMQPTDAEIQDLFGHWLAATLLPTAPEVLQRPQPARDFCAFGLQ